MSALSKFLHGASALAIQAAVQRVLGVLTSIILARGLGSAGFGAYSAVVNTANTAYGMVRLGIDAAIHVYAARGERNPEESRATAELLGAGLVLLAAAGLVAAVVVVFASSWLASVIFGQPALASVLKIAGVLTALQCLSQFSYALLAGFQSFTTYARLMIVNGVLTLALSAGGMWFHGLHGAIWGYGAAQLVLTALMGDAARRAMRARGIGLALTGWPRATASLMRLGLPFYASGLVAIPVTYFLQGLLSRSTGVDALGVLRVITTIAALVAFAPISVSAATTSTLTRVRVEEGPMSPKLFDYAFLHLKAVLYLTTVLAILVAGVLPALVRVLFGVEFAAASGPGVLALFSAAMATTAASAGSLFFAVERSEVIFWQSLLQSVVFGAAGFLLIPASGVLGYVSAEVVGNLVALIFILSAAIRLAGRRWRGTRVLETLALCLVVSLLTTIASREISDGFSLILALLLVLGCLTLGAIRLGLNEWEYSTISRVASGLLASKK